MKRNFAGPPILKDEVRAAIRKMKSGKATGPDKISVELIEALEDYGIEKTTNLLNEIYDTGQIPTDLTKSIFIALPKKPRATECELQFTQNNQPYKSCHQNIATDSNAEGKEQNKTTNSRRTMWEKEQQMPFTIFES
ncbi:hypothetical protein ElyMa_004527200 [Elysia marginata]|uniref:Reverse transcriptase domain-containing protein n=1 Tax=Elysia marginata TaxID=1093978 RepID=A0AAV4HNC1_9GAST|nr:hypothetical protein ElyMa_004527200 [Elysia marginata]